MHCWPSPLNDGGSFGVSSLKATGSMLGVGLWEAVAAARALVAVLVEATSCPNVCSASAASS